MASLICLAAGTDIRVEGQQHLLELKDSVVCMFRCDSAWRCLSDCLSVRLTALLLLLWVDSHASNLDGFIVNAASPTAFKVRHRIF